jgi:hypothetical protein
MPWLSASPEHCTAPPHPLPGCVSERLRRFAKMNGFKKAGRQ